MTSHIAEFTICHRRPDGSGFEYAPNTPEFTYVSSCIQIFRRMLSTPTGRQHLTTLGSRFDQSQPTTWYRGRYTIDQMVSQFITHILGEFPIVWIDEQIVERQITGYHPRGSWDGSFDPHRQAVCLNASVSWQIGYPVSFALSC